MLVYVYNKTFNIHYARYEYKSDIKVRNTFRDKTLEQRDGQT